MSVLGCLVLAAGTAPRLGVCAVQRMLEHLVHVLHQDEVQILAHFLGLVVLLAVALAVLWLARSRDVPEPIAARAAA